MAVRVDETGSDDPVRRIDDRGGIGGDRDIGADFANPALLDQHVGPGEVAHLPVEGEDDAAFEQDAARALQPGNLIPLPNLPQHQCVHARLRRAMRWRVREGALRQGGCGQRCGGYSGAGLEKRTARTRWAGR
jgi:hypothetical protein